MFGQQNYKLQEQELTPWKRIPNIQQGTKVIFQVKLHSIEDGFRISFLHNRIQSSKAGDSIGAGIEIINVQPKDSVIVPEYYVVKRKLHSGGQKYQLDKQHKFKAQNAYEFVIVVHSNKYEIILNNNCLNHNATLPFWATNFVAIDGNVTLLANPEVVPPKCKRHTNELRRMITIRHEHYSRMTNSSVSPGGLSTDRYYAQIGQRNKIVLMESWPWT
uniref:Galectin n=1 Tax=Globodera rostochiensis TaxID=31243 RepID=A0A914HCH6_GLORO